MTSTELLTNYWQVWLNFRGSCDPTDRVVLFRAFIPNSYEVQSMFSASRVISFLCSSFHSFDGLLVYRYWFCFLGCWKMLVFVNFPSCWCVTTRVWSVSAKKIYISDIWLMLSFMQMTHHSQKNSKYEHLTKINYNKFNWKVCYTVSKSLGWRFNAVPTKLRKQLLNFHNRALLIIKQLYFKLENKLLFGKF